MKIKQITLAFSMIMGFAPFSNAQEKTTDSNPIVEISAGVKTYYLDRMGFAPNESVSKVIESLGRFGNLGLLCSRATMVDGEICHESSILSRILVSQVECIQFITDGNQGYEVEASGYINIVLKKIEEGTHGNVTFSMDTKANHTPAGSITHKSGKWSMWASASGDMMESQYDIASSVIRSYSESIHRTAYHTATDTETHSFFANLGFGYKDEKNSLTFNVANSWMPKNVAISDANFYYSYDSTCSTSNIDTTGEETKYINNYFFASVDFKHIFSDKISLTASLSEELNNSPYWRTTVVMNKSDMVELDTLVVDLPNISNSYRIDNPHSHGYKTSLDAHLDIKASKILSLKTGIYGCWNKAKESQHMYYSNLESNTYKFVPYALAGLNFGDFTFNAGERVVFQNVGCDLDGCYDDNYDESCNKALSVTNASLSWCPSVSHQVLLSYKRLRTISSEPQHTFYQNHYTIVHNSVYNTSEDNDVLDLSYAYTGKKVSASLTAIYRDYNIENACTESLVHPNYGSEGNNYKIYSLDASAVASFGALTLNGNVNYTHLDYSYSSLNDIDTYHFWSVQMNPVLSLPYGFKASATAMYRCIINPSSYLLPESEDDLWCTLRVSKSFKNVEAFVKWENALYNKYEYTVEKDISKRGYISDDHMNQVTFGASVRF